MNIKTLKADDVIAIWIILCLLVVVVIYAVWVIKKTPPHLDSHKENPIIIKKSKTAIIVLGNRYFQIIVNVFLILIFHRIAGFEPTALTALALIYTDVFQLSDKK